MTSYTYIFGGTLPPFWKFGGALAPPSAATGYNVIIVLPMHFNSLFSSKCVLRCIKFYSHFCVNPYYKVLDVTVTMPCTNTLHKVQSVNHPVLSFCINTLRETTDSLIGVNSVVLGIVDTR